MAPEHETPDVNALRTEVTRLTGHLKAQTELVESILEGLPLALLRVNRNARILYANRTAATAVGLRERDVVGQLSGDVLRCVNALPHGNCGRGTACKTCVVRRSIEHTLDTGEQIYQQVGELRVDGGEGPSVRHLLVTTVPVVVNGEKQVVIAIDDFTDREATAVRLLEEAPPREDPAAREAGAFDSAELSRLTTASTELLLSLAPSAELRDVRRAIAGNLRRLTGAAAVWFSEYDAGRRALRLQGIDMEAPAVQRAVALLGRRLEGFESPVNDRAYEEIVSGIVARRQTLTEVSFGAIPPTLSAVLQKLLAIDHLIALAHTIEGQLFGASVLAIGPGRQDPPTEWLESIAHIVAVSLRRRSTEEALRKSEEDHRLLLRHLPAGVVVHAPDSTVRFANEQACTFLGLTLDQIMGKAAVDPAWRFVHEDGTPMPVAEFPVMRVLATRAPAHHVSVGVDRPATGDRVWGLGAAFPEFDGDDVRQIVVTFVDVTELKKAERALAESEARYRLMADRAQDVIWTVNLEGRFTYVSPAVERLRGLTVAEALAETIDQAVAPESRAAVEAAASELAAKLAAGEKDVATRLEVQQYRKDGSLTWVETVLRSLVNPQGRLNGWVGISRDINERKRAEAEHRVLQAKLAQADRLASMGMLAAGVAHEINNPLTYVLYNLESLAEDLEQYGAQPVSEALEPTTWSDLFERCRDALEGTRQMKDIVRGLGAFSRVEEEEAAPLDLRIPIESAITIAYNEVKYRATIVTDLGVTSPVLGSERATLPGLSQSHRQRSARHRRRQRRAEHDRFAHVARGRHRVRIRGRFRLRHRAGRPRSHLRPVLHHQADRRRSGLGLSIAHEIVSAYGGTIEVSSELGRGTRFLIRLPATSPQVIRDVARVADAGETEPVSGRILVIDDEPAVRSSLKRMLVGHEVVEADSGARACEILSRDTHFDVVLCDMMMPQLSGMDVHQWLVAHHPDLARRVVFVTGGAFTPNARAYLDQVNNARVEKPIDAQALRQLVASRVLAARLPAPE